MKKVIITGGFEALLGAVKQQYDELQATLSPVVENPVQEPAEPETISIVVDQKTGKPYGPYRSNRKEIRKFLSLTAARNKKSKGASEGWRGRSNDKTYPDAV